MAQVSPLPSSLTEAPLSSVQARLSLKDSVTVTISSARQKVAQSVVVFFITLLLLCLAVFLYSSFHYSYMPNAAFSAPLHYYFRTDCESPSSFLCSYPVANISLMRNKKHALHRAVEVKQVRANAGAWLFRTLNVLTFGQSYQITLQLEMPESPVNQELGMFMIRTTCFSQSGQVSSSARSTRQMLSTSSTRSSILRYRSDLLRTLGTLFFLPAFLIGAAEQKQVLEVELFSDYTDDPYAPSINAVIEILSDKVQIYSSQLYIHAHFTGLRYLLFYYPVTSALVGVSSNFIFLTILFILSYVRLLWRVKQQGAAEPLSGSQNDVTNNQQVDNVAAGTGTGQ